MAENYQLKFTVKKLPGSGCSLQITVYDGHKKSHCAVAGFWRFQYKAINNQYPVLKKYINIGTNPLEILTELKTSFIIHLSYG